MACEDIPESKDELNEPTPIYGSLTGKRLEIFHSFDEMGQASARDAASKPPIERIRDTVQLILRVYGVTQEELNKRPKPRHTTITQFE